MNFRFLSTGAKGKWPVQYGLKCFFALSVDKRIYTSMCQELTIEVISSKLKVKLHLHIENFFNSLCCHSRIHFDPFFEAPRLTLATRLHPRTRIYQTSNMKISGSCSKRTPIVSLMTNIPFEGERRSREIQQNRRVAIESL